MPFAMTHLHIAYNILNNTSEIRNPNDFMLGAIAPDSVHFREEYESDMKKASHLCVGYEKWGSVTNNEEWLENVLSFLEKNKDKEYSDFIYGYCSHVIADIQNNIKVWIPFKAENSDALKNEMGTSLCHKEANDVDYSLYLMQPEQKKIWNLLEKSSGYDIPGVVIKDETDKMKHSIMHKQFKNRQEADVSSNKYVSLISMKEFIEEESKYIKQLLYPNI